jgi:F-type H+-transporting ATPase subunit delta
MKSQILIKRYAQGLVNSIVDDREFETLNRQLVDFSNLLVKHKKMEGTLTSPFLPAAKKMQIAADVLSLDSLSKKISRFILLLVENNRLSLLADILDILPVLWNEKKGILSIEVFSAAPLSESQKKKLQEKLEILERSSVSVSYRIDPDLIGGLSIRKGNIVYDVSIKGSLENLREKIIEE